MITSLIEKLKENTFSNIYKKRMQQLEEQKKQDLLIKSLRFECPLDVIDFLLLQRKLNRKLTSKLDNADFLDYINIANQNIKYTKSDMIMFEKIVGNKLSNNNLCKPLKEYNLILQKNIKSSFIDNKK